MFTGLGVVVAGLAALLAGYYSKRTLEYSNRAQESAAQANNHADNSNVISANAWLDQYLCNVRLWADEACENIARAMHAVNLQPDERNRELYEAMYRISSLIDRGRWFFPNQWSQEYGIEKEPAYRGVRQPILDRLVEAYELAKDLLKLDGKASVAGLLHCQRLFVSEVQQVLNPRRRDREVARIYEQFAISEKLTEKKAKNG